MAKKPPPRPSKPARRPRYIDVTAPKAPQPEAKTKTKTTSKTAVPSPRPTSIVGIGASAGGLEAFEQLLQALTQDSGMGFVLVQHLAPTHESFLSELLAKSTRMPVI